MVRLFNANGQFLTENGDVASFTKGIENRVIAYKKTTGTALYASFGFHYVMNDVFDIIIEPNIKYGPGSITTEDYTLDEKHTTVGLLTGIRYKF